MDDYLKFRALHQGSTPGSVEQYERTYRSLLTALPHDTPRAFTQEAIHKWTMAELERGVSARTVDSRLAHLSALGDYLVKHRLLAENPARAVERPRYKRKPQGFLYPEELKAFLALERPEHEDIARVLFLDTLLRVSELANATVGDLEQTEGRVYLRVRVKGGDEKRVPLSPDVADRVRAYLAGRGTLPRTAPLLVNSRGEKWTRTGLSQRMASIAKQAGITRINVSAHKLRHTGNVVARRAGLDSLTRSALLNHSDTRTVQQYDHLLPDETYQARLRQREGLARYLGS